MLWHVSRQEQDHFMAWKDIEVKRLLAILSFHAFLLQKFNNISCLNKNRENILKQKWICIYNKFNSQLSNILPSNLLHKIKYHHNVLYDSFNVNIGKNTYKITYKIGWQSWSLFSLAPACSLQSTTYKQQCQRFSH